MSFALSIALIAAQAAATPAIAVEEPDPKMMKTAEIRAFNAKLPRSHPYYIRCVKTANVGSLVARNVSCRTNEQWDKSDRIGNDNARETVEFAKGKALNGN